MLTKHLAAAAFAVRLLAGQTSTDAKYDETAFRKDLETGLPPGHGNRAAYFAVSHDEVAVPILVAAVKPKLNGKQPEWFVTESVDWITRNLNQRSIDAIAALCAADQGTCPWMVKMLLAQAAARGRQYEIAYKVAEQHPELTQLEVAWIVDVMRSNVQERVFARELLNREKEGHSIGRNDPLLPRLPTAIRERVNTAVGNLRNEDRQRSNKQ